MSGVSALRDTIVGAAMGVLGAVCGVLSGVALGVAAVVPPILGMIALLLSPLRALAERLTRPRAT
jgi:hypothetical protein